MPKIRKLRSSVDEYIKARTNGEELMKKASEWANRKRRR